ncbi:hypothetical protein [Streptomyces sp. NPDC088246]|uniref:hypothetical protein n=1 Tax=Streptomyces sp. NPDC088246 TaxID=3365842 RepID=UPI00381925D7
MVGGDGLAGLEAEHSGAPRLRSKDRIPARPEGRDSLRGSGMTDFFEQPEAADEAMVPPAEVFHLA